jgi:hypothetical protein
MRLHPQWCPCREGRNSRRNARWCSAASHRRAPAGSLPPSRCGCGPSCPASAGESLGHRALGWPVHVEVVCEDELRARVRTGPRTDAAAPSADQLVPNQRASCEPACRPWHRGSERAHVAARHSIVRAAIVSAKSGESFVVGNSYPRRRSAKLPRPAAVGDGPHAPRRRTIAPCVGKRQVPERTGGCTARGSRRRRRVTWRPGSSICPSTTRRTSRPGEPGWRPTMTVPVACGWHRGGRPADGTRSPTRTWSRRPSASAGSTPR